MIRFQALESLRNLDAQEFDRLDASCGPVGSYSRLVQLERDYRWSTEYLCARESSILLAAVPLYRLAKGAWPDPSYDPATWGLGQPTLPSDVTVAGGRSGLLSSLHVAPAISGTWRHIRLIEELLTRESRTSLLLPYLTENELGPWEGVLGSRLERQALGADARFDGHLAGETFSRKVRQTLHRDERMVERYGVESSVRTWGEVRSFAAGLIADNSRAKGLPDAEQLVDFRVRQWEACEGVSVVVLTAKAHGEHGVGVCVIWRDWIDLQEIGITGTPSDVRRTLYAQLLFHLPVWLARQRGSVRHIRVGLKAEQAKAIRGASFIPLAGGTFSFSSRHNSRSYS
ncbi:MAG TPA: hypothetical protein VNF47_05200 [Streptosporangiaceae bacterium]|nr:hypothetical protein [Streptosporangiaceae bacterium]